MIITERDEAKVILQDIESFENMKNLLELLKLLGQGEKDLTRIIKYIATDSPQLLEKTYVQSKRSLEDFLWQRFMN